MTHRSPYLRPDEAAPIIRRSRHSVYRYIREGKLGGVKLDPDPDPRRERSRRPIVVPVTELAAFLHRCGDADALHRLRECLAHADLLAFIRVWGDRQALNRLREFIAASSDGDIASLCPDRLALARLRDFLSLPLQHR